MLAVVFLINISSISVSLYSNVTDIKNITTSHKVWFNSSYNIQTNIKIIKSDIYIHKKESELKTAEKLKSQVKKMILIDFKDSSIYQLYNQEKDKMIFFCSIIINEELMKSSISIFVFTQMTTPSFSFIVNSENKKTQFYIKKSVNEHVQQSTSQNITENESVKQENQSEIMIFNSVTQRSALNVIQSLKQSKKKRRFFKKSVKDLNILFTSSKSIKQQSEWLHKNAAAVKSLIEPSNNSESDLNNSLLDSVTIKAQKLIWVKSVVTS